MSKSLKCFFGQHNYKVLSTEDYKDTRDNVIGKIIINRCEDCGKIKEIKVITVNGIF